MTEINTSLSNDLEEANYQVQYDQNIKNILANKIILAWILKYTVNDFKEASIERIIELIEGEPQVSIVPVGPGRSRPKIVGMNTEDNIPNEGVIYYDIRFSVFTPSMQSVKLLMNLEAQKDFHISYDLVTRGVFYCARMLSSQKEREFENSDYDSIKKVYSIWICMNAPTYAKNTITSYRMEKKNLYGENKMQARFDILEVVMICLDKVDTESDSKLLGMLNTLLSKDITAEDKKKRLYNEYGISPTVKMEKEMRQMCNLSDLVLEEGLERGMQRGEAKTIVSLIEKYISKNNATLETALETLDISIDEYENAKKIVESYT